MNSAINGFLDLPTSFKNKLVLFTIDIIRIVDWALTKDTESTFSNYLCQNKCSSMIPKQILITKTNHSLIHLKQVVKYSQITFSCLVIVGEAFLR